LNAARVASPFVVPLGAIAAGNAQVTASSNVSSHVPSVFTSISLPPIFGAREPRADISRPEVDACVSERQAFAGPASF